MYFCWKNVSSFCKCKSYSHFFSKNIYVYAIFNDQSLNDTLTNDIVSFEQLDPGVYVNYEENDTVLSIYGEWINLEKFLHFFQGDKFCEFKFAFLHTKSLLKRGPLTGKNLHLLEAEFAQPQKQLLCF